MVEWAMGSQKSICSTRCRYAACFSLGFVVASIILAVMFWIIWCYMGLSIVQISDTQRRAVVSYSYTTSKPPSTSSPTNRTEVYGALESSLNAISKSPVTPPTQPRRRSDSSTDLAKGDFAARPQGGASQNSTRRESITSSVTSSQELKGSILNKGEEDGLHPRKVSTSNKENRNPVESLPEIKPTQTYAPAQSDPVPIAPKEERRTVVRDSDRKDEVQSSRPSYRDPEFERDLPPRKSEPGRRRYYEEDDYYDRGSPSRYDKRDRGRDTDDRYSKGDSRVYPDEKPRHDDRSLPRDSGRRRGDDRDREDWYRDRDDRYREDRYRDMDDRRSEDRYRDEDDRDREYWYRDRDVKQREDRYPDSDDRDHESRYRDRDERDREYRYRDRDDRPRDYDDRYRDRDDRPRDYDDRYRDRLYSDKRERITTKDDEDRYTPSRDRDYREPIMSSRPDIPLDRKSGKPEDSRRPSDYDVPIRERPRISYDDESRTIDRNPSRRDEYLRPFKYDDRDSISPTRTKEEAYVSRATLPLPRSKDDAFESGSSIIDGRKRDDDRYSNNRDRSRYYGDDNRRGEESRYIAPSSVRETDDTRRDVKRDDYPSKSVDDKKLDDIGLERRSYSAEEEYRRQNSRTRYYDDKDRKTSENLRPDYRTDDHYSRSRTDDDEYRRSRARGDYDIDRSRSPDRYDRPIDVDDRPSRRYDELRRRISADVGLRKESYPPDVIDEDKTLLRRPEGRLPVKDRRYEDDIPPRRTSYEDTVDDRPLRSTVDRASEGGRRYKDDAPSSPDDSSRRVPLRSEKRESFVDSPTSPRDEVVREKRYQNSGRPFENSGNEERPINTKDVIETALKQQDAPNHNPREVFYPVYNPRLSNLTSPDHIALSDRRGTTITSRRRRSRGTY